MAESFVEITGVPKDTEKRRLRTHKRTIGLDEVHEEAVFIVDGDGNIVSGSVLQALHDVALTLSRFSPDSAGRMRIIIDVAGTATPISTVATLSALSAITTFPYGQSWELMQRGNMEYAECQRNKFTFA
jgi:hypothetical protein